MYRYFIILASLLALFPTRGAAQQLIDSWEVYSNFGIDNADIIDTDKRVYFCGGGSLFHYDKELDETYSYNMGNGLSDVGVVGIYRNFDRNFTVAVYSNCNLDLVYDDGRIVNLSDIKDAQYVTDKTINYITFDGDEMYVATGFGLVRYDTAIGAVMESGIFSSPVHGATVLAGKVVISLDSGLYFIDKSMHINDLSRYTQLTDQPCEWLETMAGDHLAAWQPAVGRFYIYAVDFENLSMKSRGSYVYYGDVNFRRFGEFSALNVGRRLYLFRLNENNRFDLRTISLPATLYTTNIYFTGTSAADAGDIWYVNDYGLGHLSFSAAYFDLADNDENFTVDREPTYPMGTSIHGGPTRLTPSTLGLYITFNARSRFPDHDDYYNLMKINLLDNGFISDVTPKVGDYTVVNSSSENALRTGYRVVVDPEDPSTIYVPTWFEGVWKFKDGVEVAKYDHTNSPVRKGWACSVEDVSFDSNNNLWIIYQDFINNLEKVSILPYAKNQANECAQADWITLDLPDFGASASKESQIVHLKHHKNSNLAIITQAYGNKNLVIYDTKGTSAVSDDTYWMVNQFTDQDGKVFGPYTVLSIVEDQNGDVWLGTECGVVVIHNLATMLSAQDNTVERVKVPRSDGSSLADYLLDNQAVKAIAVDANNCKWLGTTTSGVYYVSADGREIIGTYLRSNSMIPSNEVQSIACDPNSNDVYFGTTNGLAVYHSKAVPPAANLSEVYAFPNPVRPDYTGMITIKGLMDNTLVKIADSAGNVFLQTRSEGGIVMWDGCNASGERVATGVYYVYVSQNQESTNGAVAKILVVK